jgi:cyanophycin synthetase
MVDLEELNGATSDKLPGFNDRLMDWLPATAGHRAGCGEPVGFYDGLRRGINLAQVLEHVMLALSELAGKPAGFGSTCPTAEAGVFTVVAAYEEEGLARACLEAARTLCLAAVSDRPFDVAAEVERLCNVAYFACLGPSTRAIVEAALARGIPARRLNAESLVMLGHGARQRRILTAETDRTGAIAERIAQDKELTRSLLGVVGVPVPEGRPVDSAEDAWAAAQEIGGAVVVKPRDANHARGVATGLTTRAQVVGAYEAALKEGTGVLVERYAPGVDHRLLVVGGRLIAAARREAAQVVGDGSSTIAELVERINQDPRRGDGFLTPLGRIPLDAPALDVLSSQGYTPESIPPKGNRVQMRRQSHIITGGVAYDVTDRVHPAVATRAVEAARVVGLDVAGIDIVATDVSRPLEEQGGVVVEVNAGPGLGLHLPPWSDPARPVGEAIIGLLFPMGENGRIPIVAVVGHGAEAVVDRIAGVLGNAGRQVGRAHAGGMFVGQRQINRRDGSGADGAWTVLRNPFVELAVLETSRQGVREAGLGFDRCDVVVVLDVEGGGKVERVVVGALAPGGAALLRADDPAAADLAAKAPHVIRIGHEDRGRAVFARDGTIVLVDDGKEQDRIPFPGATAETLIAVATAWALGLEREAIRDGLGDIKAGQP